MNAGSQPVALVGQRRPIANALGAAAAMADGLLERRSASVARPLSVRELRAERAMVVAFAATAAAMLLALPSERGWDPVSATLLVGTYALVARVRFQLGPGLVRPTELLFARHARHSRHPQ